MTVSNLIKPYRALREEFYGDAGKKDFSSVLIEEDDGPQEFTISPMGAGGSKRAYRCMGSTKALILPNMDCNPLSEIQEGWARVVDKEVRMSETLEKIGLLSLRCKKVQVSTNSDPSQSIPAYVADNFESLAERGIYVIDQKNNSSSTLKKKIFQKPSDALDKRQWRDILNPLVDDVAKLVIHDIPTGSDSISYALVETESSSYQLRFLGFDYTTRSGEGRIPEVEDPSGKKKCCDRITRIGRSIFNAVKNRISHGTAIRDIVEEAVRSLFENEFRPENGSNPFGNPLSEEAEALCNQLTNELTRAVYLRIAQLTFTS